MVQTAIDAGRLDIGPVATGSGPSHEKLVISTLQSDAIVQGMIDATKIKQSGMPVYIGEVLAYILRSRGPSGINFARYSIDYHILRNYLHVLNDGQQNSSLLIECPDDVTNTLPSFCADIVNHYMKNDKNFRELVAKINEKQK